MNDLTRYHQCQAQMRAGDILFFGGCDASDVVCIVEHFVPNSIGAVTRSNLTHVTMILDPTLLVSGKPQTELMLLESTIAHGKNGPQINPVEKTIAEYDGLVWWAPLSERDRAMVDWPALWSFALSKVGTDHYAIKTLTDTLVRKFTPIGWLPWFHRPDPKGEVCSEFIAENFRAGGLPGIETHEVSPQSWAQMHIYEGLVQLVGSPAKIRGFNSI